MATPKQETKNVGTLAFFLLLILTLTSLFNVGCAKRVGCNMIKVSHGNYNRVVSCIQREELLLNLVRRRYLEPPQFTSIGTISQSRSRTSSASGSLSFATPVTGGSVFSTSVGDFPTYSITPQSGPEAYQALHNEVPVEVFARLANAGYSLDLIFTLLAKEVCGVRGAEICAGGGIKGGSSEYMQMLTAIQCLEGQGKVTVTNAVWEEKLFEHPFAPEVFTPETIAAIQEGEHNYTTTDDGQSFFVTSRTAQPVFWMAKEVRHSGDGRELLQLWGLNPDQKKKGWALRSDKFVQGVDFAELEESKLKDHVTVQTRSIFGVLNLLCQGVCVPQSDQCKVGCPGEVFREAVECGRVPDIASQFVVHYSCECPECAFVAVKHRCGWFYIKDTDTCSKKYFNALFDLYNLSGPERIDAGSSGRITSPVVSFP